MPATNINAQIVVDDSTASRLTSLPQVTQSTSLLLEPAG